MYKRQRTRERRPDLYELYARKGRALGYLQKRKLSHMDMLEVIRRGQGELLYGAEDGVLVRDIPSGACMTVSYTHLWRMRIFWKRESESSPSRRERSCRI